MWRASKRVRARWVRFEGREMGSVEGMLEEGMGLDRIRTMGARVWIDGGLRVERP